MIKKITFLMMLGLLNFSVAAFAADIDVLASPLKSADVENASFAYTSDGDITIMFAPRPSFPSLAAGTVLADGGVSGGVFSGDYLTAGISKIGFRIKSEFDVSVPVKASVVMNSASGRSWRNQNISVSVVGGLWVGNNIEFSLDAGWERDGGGDRAATWTEDLRNVETIGVRLTQVGSAAQYYTVGTFVLLDASGKSVGESGLLPARIFDYFETAYLVADVNDITDEMKNADNDGDGMTNWEELLVGTDPDDVTSVFAAEIIDYRDAGITISWPCIFDGTYDVMKREGFGSDFSVIQVGVKPDATEIVNGVMSFEDTFQTGRGPYMYKILKR